MDDKELCKFEGYSTDYYHRIDKNIIVDSNKELRLEIINNSGQASPILGSITFNSIRSNHSIDAPCAAFIGDIQYKNNIYSIWNGKEWCLPNGQVSKELKGDTSKRPTLESKDTGYMYYDTSLKKYICWNGSDWSNLDGTSLFIEDK